MDLPMEAMAGQEGISTFKLSGEKPHYIKWHGEAR